MAGKSLFSCLIVDINFYTASPVKDLDVCYSDYRSSAVPNVPVVRIFGSTPAGQKTCLHVHGVFPYVYVPCHVTDPSSRYLQLLARSIDQALHVSLGTESKSDQHHVFKIAVVKGISMYGYHDNEELFLKIYLYNPALIKRLSDLLAAGAVMGTVLQPHESHIPFVLQFMIDYNLYGMNFIHFSSVKFRAGGDVNGDASPTQSVRSGSVSSPLPSPLSPPPSSSSSSLVCTPSQQVWNVDSLPSSLVVCVPRVSVSELEVDGLAVDIVNRQQQLSLTCGGFPGLAAIWEEERDRRRLMGLSTSLTPPPSPDRVPGEAQPVELRLRGELTAILKEKLGRSASPFVMDSEPSPPSTSSPSVSRSCDLQPHRPITLEDSQPVARQLPMGGEVVVDEEAIQQSMELSQRLSLETLRKSTDVELLDLMMELAQTQVGSATQPSQSLYHTPTVVASLSSQFKRSLSTPARLSSLLAPSQPSFLSSQFAASRSQPVCDTGRTGSLVAETSSVAGVRHAQIGSGSDDVAAVVGSGDAMDWRGTEDVDKFLVAGEDLLNKSDKFGTTGKASTDTKSDDNSSKIDTPAVTKHAHTSQNETESPNAESVFTRLVLPMELHSPQSLVFSDEDLFDEFPLDTSPPSPPPPPPPHELLEEMENGSSEREFELSLEGDEEESEKNLSVMLNSSAVSRNTEDDDTIEGSPNFDTQFDIPCAQPLSSQERETATTTQASRSRANERDDSAASSDNLDGGRTVGVQLEYEMPEISLSQHEAFQSAMADILGTPSKMGGARNSPRKVASHGIPLVGSHIPSSQQPTLSSTAGQSSENGGEREHEGKMEDGRTYSISGGVRSEGDSEGDTVDVGEGESSPGKERDQQEQATLSDSSSICLTFSQRRTILHQLCSREGSGSSSEEEAEEGVDSGDGSEGEGEDVWRSGQAWDTNSIPESQLESCDQPEVSGNIGQPDNHFDQLDGNISQVDDDISQLDNSIGQLDNGIGQLDNGISQLDGTPDESRKRQPGKKTLGVRRKNLQKQTTTVRRSGWLPSNPKLKGESSSSLAGNHKTSSDDVSEAAHDGRGSVSVTRQEGAEINSLGSSNEALVLEEASREGGGGGSLTGAVTDSSVEQRLRGAAISSAESVEQRLRGAAISSTESVEQRLRGAAISSAEESVEQRRDQAPSSPCAAEKSLKMTRKEKLSLSLKSRKRKSYHRLPAQSPSSGGLSGIESGVNTHPLAAKWKKNALLNPPYINILKLKLSPAQVRRRKREGESAKRRTGSDSSGTSSSSWGKGEEKKREKLTEQVVVHTVNTRRRAKQRRNSGIPDSEVEELEMALQESLDTLRTSSSTQGECSTSLEEPSETLLCIEGNDSSSSGSIGVGDFEPARKHLRNNSDSSKVSSSDGRISAKGVSLLDEMPTVKGGEELVISSEKMEMEDGCASEASSQGIESDFNLVMTESESDSDERAVGVSRKRRRTEEVEEVVGPCTAQHACVTLGERYSPSLLPRSSRILTASSSLQPHLLSLPLPHPRPTDPVLPQVLHYQGPPSSSSRHLPLSPPQHMCTEASAPTTKASSSTQAKPPSLSRYITNQTPPRMEIVPAPSLSVLRPVREPPSVARLCETAASYGLPAAVHTRAFYSNPADVQPPREVNRKLVRVCSRMPYDLQEAEPPILTRGGSGAPLSSTGLWHWRAVLSTLSSASQPTEMLLPLPPLCHPPPGAKTNQLVHYTTEEHKRDVRLRSAFLPAGKVILTPVNEPPNPRDVERWLESRLGERRPARIVGKSSQERLLDESVVGTTESESNQDAVAGASGAGVGGAPDVIKIEIERESKSPVSVVSESSTVQLDQEQEQPSFTSYQLPKDARDSKPYASGRITENESEIVSKTVDFHDSSVSGELGSSRQHLLHSTPLLGGNGEKGTRERGDEKMVVETENRKEREGEQKEERSNSGSTPVRPSAVDGLVDSARPMNLTFPGSLRRDTSQLEGPTPQNTYGFKISQSALATSSDTHEYLTCMSVELHTRTRGSLRPDPEWDPVLAVFYYIHHDCPRSIPGGHPRNLENSHLGVIAIDVENCNFTTVHSSRLVKGKASPKKQPIKSPDKSPRQRPKKSPAKSPTKRPIKSPAKSPSNQSNTSARVSPNQSRVQSSQILNSSASATTRGYLSGCVGGRGGGGGVEVRYVSSEQQLLEELTATVRRHDPDILLGYEVTMTSWGYLIDRAAALNVNLTNQISRLPNPSGNKAGKERSGSSTGTRRPSLSQVRIPGRILLSVWRILRKEIALTSYSFESTFFQVMHQRIPTFSFQTLTHWYEMGTRANRSEVVEHYQLRCHGNYQLLERLNVIGRTSEFARLYGIEFENVLSRGTQYRVESMLLRLAKPANYIAVSPTVQQRARMAAPECLQLILEPESKFYTDPVVVLDFQSLYPSIVIGYNYCYTTCLGRVRNLALHGDFTFGTNSLNIPPHVLKKVKDNITVSPNGVVFVTPEIRRGLMPRMLEEILGTRIMVKGSMKQHKEDKALHRMLDARQLGLKLISNVTYGYTAANFSGRMPCVEVADSIVGKARETLERTIQMIRGTPEWGAKVVYGDTDSVFVLLKGASKNEAFRIGKEICARVTADNPKPVKLKFEKVYYPCILQTKKRYCGFMYETPDQTEPLYDAKGIETVRRDTCPAVAKVLQKSLSLLFSSRDVSLVKAYVQRQFRKLLDGHVSIQDYILAKEYRGRGNYRAGACVPAVELSRRAVESDPRAEPRPGERVPYVVVYGHPGQPLIQLVRSPLEVAKDPSLRLNGIYYITKQVLPALGRALSLLGVDVHQWYSELPRVFRAPLPQPQEVTNRKLKGTLGQYFATMHCPVCEELTADSMCSRCRGNPQRAAAMLSQHIHDLESAHYSVTMLCQSCTRNSDPAHSSQCISLDCPVFYRHMRTLQSLPSATSLHRLLSTLSPSI